MNIIESIDGLGMGSIVPNSIVKADCLEAMKLIPDKSIDCIIADLPYGITACKWDTVVPFEPLWEQYKRIIKPNGAIVLFGSQPFTSALVMSNPKWFKYEWIWEKSIASGFLHSKNSPLKSHENILIFSGGTIGHEGKVVNRMKYHPQMGKGLAYTQLKKPESRFKWGSIARPSTNNVFLAENHGTRYPKTVLDFANPNSANIHPTQKPVPLIEYLLKTYSLEGELILDNTAGSGTLAIACINTNRRYICIEKDLDYFEVMRNRIENHDPNAPIKTKKTKSVAKD